MYKALEEGFSTRGDFVPQEIFAMSKGGGATGSSGQRSGAAKHPTGTQDSKERIGFQFFPKASRSSATLPSS